MANKKSNSKNINTKSKTQQKKQIEYEEEYYEPSFFTSPLFVHGVIWTLLFVFLTIFMFVPSDALVSNAVRGTLGGVFGILSYVIPFIFAGTLLYLVYTKSVSGMWKKFILSVLAITDLSAIIGLFANYDAVSAYSICRASMNGGGAAGVMIAEKLSEMITQIGAFLVLFILFVVLCCFIAHYNIWPHLINGVKSFCGFSENVGSRVRQKSGELAEKHRQRREAYEEYDEYLEEDLDKEESEKPSNLFFDDDEDELPESLIERFKKKKALKMQEEAPRTGHTRTIDIANDFASDLDGNLAASKQDLFSEDFGDDEKFDLYNMKFNTDSNDEPEVITPEPVKNPAPEPAPIKEQTIAEPDAPAERQEAVGDFQVNEMKQTEQAKEKKLTNNEKLSFRDELDNALQSDYVEYRFPTLDLLDKEKAASSDLRQELYNRAQQLISVLDNFGVKAKPVQVTQGPAVTRYEIQPSSGTKLSKIVNLANDIAMNLAVSTVLIAPVPGKAGTVGVEIPNNKVTPVSIREMLGSVEFRNAKSKLTVCLGKDIGGNVVVGDIAKWPHALIAGATGSGKSVCINTIVTSILYKADPNEVKLIMVDPKQVELGVYNGIPHLLIPVVTEAKKAAGALNWAVSEMMNRYELFKDSGVRKLEMYNKLMEKTGGEKLPQIVIIIDELADLMMVAAKEVEDYVCRLAQLARAAGIHLIIATQRPSVDVITGLIKANIPSRIAFFVSSQVDSRTILDKAGAEKLLGMGDMLYYPTGARSTTRVQGAFVSDGEVERIVNFIKDTTPETHYSEDLEEHIERIATGENGVTPDKEEDGDPLLNDAIQLAVELGKISTSMVQRRLSVGYARAGRIVDQMEARGIVSPANGSKPREVLVSHADMMFNNSEGNADE